MNYDKIIYPEFLTYYICTDANGQLINDKFGSVSTNEIMAVNIPIEQILQYTDFNLWKTELAMYNITVALDENNNWYKIE